MTTELQNKAWACLPKEFKEEVKKQYQIAIDSKAYAVEYTLEYLFDLHNLTSDAVEEEMLTVRRAMDLADALIAEAAKGESK